MNKARKPMSMAYFCYADRVEKNVQINWGEWIKARLDHLQFSQRELARRLQRQSDTVNRWLSEPHLPLKNKDISPVAAQLELHPDDLPYAHLLYQPDDPLIDPDQPRITELIGLVYTERHVGNPHPINAENMGQEMRPMPHVLAEAAAWLQHEIAELIGRYKLIMHYDFASSASDALEMAGSIEPSVAPLGIPSDPAAAIRRTALHLRESFNIEQLAQAIPSSLDWLKPEDINIDSILDKLATVQDDPAYKLYVRSAQLMKDASTKRKTDIEVEQERQAIETELAGLKPMLRAAKPANKRRGRT